MSMSAITQSDVIKTGFLSKKSEDKKTWQVRWFELRPATLSYYTNKKVKPANNPLECAY